MLWHLGRGNSRRRLRFRGRRYAPAAVPKPAHHDSFQRRCLFAAFSTPESLREDFTFIRASFPDLLPGQPLPVGYGFIGWLLDKNEEAGKRLIDIVIENGVRAIWLAFGNDIHRWIEYVRTSPANATVDHKPLIFFQATSVEEALVAANEWKVDVIVAQGAPSNPD